MKTTRVFACLIFSASLVLAVCARAQSAATGSIEGHVKNAVTGENLNHARVSVKGTTRATLTDDSGSFRLDNVPAGTTTLRVFFTGLDEQESTVTVAGGQTQQQDFGLTSTSRYGANAETVKLDQFVVESTRETNAAAIAVNEQRLASNIKSVVSTDEFGIIPDSNPGEFLKWLPGVGVEYFANNITGVNVRGLGAVNTEINFDGLSVASANADGTSRQFELMGASSVDIARVEVRKLPLPEDSANAIGGSINFIRRSAFEYSHRKVDYQLGFTGDGEKLTFAERDGPRDRKQQYWQPNWKLTWTEPVTKDFGMAFAMGQSNTIVRTRFNNPTWSYGTAAQLTQAQADVAANKALTTVSLLNPAMTQMLLHDAPKKDSRTFGSARFDWRPFPALTLGYSLAYTKFRSVQADDIRYTWNTAATGSGDPQFVDRHTTIGRNLGGAIFYNTPLWRDIDESTVTHSFEAKWKKDSWTASFKGALSQSKYWIDSASHGMFNSLSGGGVPSTGVGFGTANPIPITVTFSDIDYRGPRQITAKDASGNLVDWSSAAVARIGGAVDRPGRSKDDVVASKIFLRKDFSFSNPLAVQLGLDYTDEYKNRRYAMNVWKFVGADHIASTADDAASQISADFLSRDRDPYAHTPAIDHLSLTKLYGLYKAHPDYFVYDDNQSYRNTVINSYHYDEKTTAPYLEFFQGLFNNRLQLSGGVRFERAEASGVGYFLDQSAAYQKYSNGVVKHAGDTVGANGLPTKSAGAVVFLPGVTSGSYQEALLTMKDEGATGHSDLQNSFPSFDANYDLTPNLKLQFGYAKTQAKNQLTRTVIPNNTVSDTVQSDGALGLVSLRNANLEPWIGYNYDLRLIYYSNSGGDIGLGVFRKSIHNWQVTQTTTLNSAADAAEFGLSDQYVGYDVSTLFNRGNARIDGAEFEMRQSLDRIMPDWGKGFTASATYTYTNLIGQAPNTDLGSVSDYRGTLFLRYNRRKLALGLGWTRNGPNANGVVTAAGITATQVVRAYDMIDFNIDYSLSKHVRLFAAGRNVHNAWKLREVLYPGAPSYGILNSSNNFGVTFTGGVTGTF